MDEIGGNMAVKWARFSTWSLLFHGLAPAESSCSLGDELSVAHTSDTGSPVTQALPDYTWFCC